MCNLYFSSRVLAEGYCTPFVTIPQAACRNRERCIARNWKCTSHNSFTARDQRRKRTAQICLSCPGVMSGDRALMRRIFPTPQCPRMYGGSLTPRPQSPALCHLPPMILRQICLSAGQLDLTHCASWHSQCSKVPRGPSAQSYCFHKLHDLWHLIFNPFCFVRRDSPLFNEPTLHFYIQERPECLHFRQPGHQRCRNPEYPISTCSRYLWVTLS